MEAQGAPYACAVSNGTAATPAVEGWQAPRHTSLEAPLRQRHSDQTPCGTRTQRAQRRGARGRTTTSLIHPCFVEAALGVHQGVAMGMTPPQWEVGKADKPETFVTHPNWRCYWLQVHLPKVDHLDFWPCTSAMCSGSYSPGFFRPHTTEMCSHQTKPPLMSSFSQDCWTRNLQGGCSLGAGETAGMTGVAVGN